MPTVSYGPKVKQRTKRLLEALLAYANDELENSVSEAASQKLRLQIQVNWQKEKQLVVRTKVRILEELTALDRYPGKLSNEQIKESLNRLEDFLEIRENNRTARRGSEIWHFTLKLWHGRNDTEANLRQFDIEWERRRPEKSKQVTNDEESVNSSQSYGEAADIYNDSGVEHYLADRLPLAVSDFCLALKRDPNFAETHYNLGSVYEDLRHFDRAREEYRIAMLGGLAAAYNNLARLYILEKDYTAAVDLLLKGLKLAEHKAEHYALWKNLGWARLEQGRYADAKACLQTAIDLEREQAPAYCLLAQALEKLGEDVEALIAWENGLRYASSYRPDEDAWIETARQRLAQSKNSQ